MKIALFIILKSLKEIVTIGGLAHLTKIRLSRLMNSSSPCFELKL